MSQMIKVNTLSADGIEIKEVAFEEARGLIAEAYAEVNVVIDKGSGNVIDNLTPEVKEIILVAIIAGG